MVFRSEARARASVRRAGALVIVLTSTMWGQQGTWQVRHVHWRNGSAGTLQVSADSIRYEEKDKKGQVMAHSREWRYSEIRMMVLGTKTLRILTYEDQKWELDRDREFVFDQLPPAMFTELYAAWRDTLDARFVAALADPGVARQWEVPVKLAVGRGGSQGALIVGNDDQVVYRTTQGEESRTWRIRDIASVSSDGPFDLTITTHEKEFRFQLKEAMPEDRYNGLWRRINRANGLQILNTSN